VAKLLAGLSAVLVLALGLAYFLAGRRMGASYEVAEVIAIEMGPESATLVFRCARRRRSSMRGRSPRSPERISRPERLG